MLVAGDLGFQSLVLVACLLFPVIGLVVRHKWRLGMDRKEEIKRLLVLASEEAARVELEASFGYTAVPISRNNHCAVCYSPTTTRCARCKTVRYCSGKCQIIHWRQGHKEECHPPRISDWVLEKESYSTNQHHRGSYDKKFEVEVEQHREPDKTVYDALASSNTGCSSDGPRGEDIGLELHADRKEKDSTSELPVTSFSEFCASTLSSESSDDVSVSEGSSQSGSPRSDGYLSAQTSFDEQRTASRVLIVDPKKPLSPKSTHLVNSVDKFAKLKTENHSKSIGIDPDCGTPLTASIVTSIGGSSEGSKNEFCSASSGFQERVRNSIGSEGGIHEDSVPSSINGSNNRNSSESRAFLHFSFSLSGGTSQSNAQSTEVDEIIEGGNLPAASGINKTTGSTLHSEINFESLKVRNSTSCCEGSQDTDNTTKELSGFGVVKSMSSSSSRVNSFPAARSELRGIRDSCYSMSAPLMFERSYPAPIDPGNISNMSKFSGSLSVDDSSDHLPSIIGEVSIPPTHSKTVGGMRVSAGVSSPEANFSSNSVYGVRPSVKNELRRSKSEHNYVVNGTEISGRYSNKGNFPYEFFVNLYNWNKVELRPSGLVNCGNSCYANVVLQCLAFTPPLTAYFLQGLHSKACAKEGWCFACEFESLVLKAKEGKSPLSPSGIISQLRKIGSQLVNGKEEDAHEFLRCAIDTMQPICFTEAQVSQSGTVEEETTLIGLTFGGYLLSKIKCTRCESKSERIERILDLTVEISGDIETMEEALQQYTSTEILDGDNRYQCSRCKSYVKAKKKLTILEAPNILTIALKRFQSGKYGKLNKPVVFSEILDLAPFMSGRSDKSPVYRLYGVIVHLDVMNAAFSGHYVCYVRNNQNKWFKIDDSTVTAMNYENVLTKGAYMLFYARCSPRAPRLIRSKITTDPKDICIPSWINGRNTSFKSSSNSKYPDSQNFHISNSSNDPANISSFYQKFRQLQKILEEDLTSDNSSLLSSNSDESSCSTNSTSDSTSTDDLSDYIYGDSGCGWNGLQNPSDIDASSSSSSSSSPLLHLADSSQSALAGVRTGGFQSGHPNHTNGISSLGREKTVYLEGKNGVSLHSDPSRQCRKVMSNS